VTKIKEIYGFLLKQTYFF